jgi:hypothetical protein
MSRDEVLRPFGAVSASDLRSGVTVPDGNLWSRLPWIAGVAGALGVIVSLAMGWGHSQLWFSWLTSYLYFLSIALGGLFFVLALYVTKAGWGVVVRRTAENAMSTLPLFAVLFVPIWLGRHELFHWMDAEAVAEDAILQSKTWWLDESFFLVRAFVYFALWSLLALGFAAQSLRQDRTGDHEVTRRLQRLSGPAIYVFALTTSAAAIDWIMSLDPHWYSTIFGVYYFAGTLVGIFAFTIVVLVSLQGAGLLRPVLNTEHYHDMGKLLFAFTVFWTYIGFSQYFLIWYANIPEETVWYAHRLEGSWQSLSIFLAVGHFLVPFFFLMSRTVKRRKPLLLAGALWMLAMHFVDVYWCVMPVLHHDGFHVSVLDFTTFLGVGGLFVALFSRLLARRALIPVKDPRLPESLGYENV